MLIDFQNTNNSNDSNDNNLPTAAQLAGEVLAAVVSGVSLFYNVYWLCLSIFIKPMTVPSSVIVTILQQVDVELLTMYVHTWQ